MRKLDRGEAFGVWPDGAKLRAIGGVPHLHRRQQQDIRVGFLGDVDRLEVAQGDTRSAVFDRDAARAFLNHEVFGADPHASRERLDGNRGDSRLLAGAFAIDQ